MLHYSVLALMSHACYCLPFQSNLPLNDSLSIYSFNELAEKLDTTQNPVSQKLYAAAFLKRAKQEHDLKKVFEGYNNQVYLQEFDEQKLAYCDSMIIVANKLKADTLLASACLTKGAVFYSKKKYIPALDYFLKARNKVRESSNPYLYHKSSYCIAQVKYYLGFYQDAITLLKDCMVFFENENPRAYLNSLHLLGLAYNKNKQYALCSNTNQKGLAESGRLEETAMVQYFMHSEGVNLYFKNEIGKAIKHLEGSLPSLLSREDFANQSVAYFYLGKCYLELGKEHQGITYLKKVHELFKLKEYIRPDLLETYKLLTSYYRRNGDMQKQLFYTNAFLAADSILDADYHALSVKLHKDYDTKQLRLEKQQLGDNLKNSKTLQIALISIIVAVASFCLVLLYRHRRLRKSYSQKFAEAIQKTQIQATETKTATLILKDELITELLKKLENFEKEQKYLDKNISLNKMAELFDTNTKYVTLIIHHHRGKKTNTYLNDLKISHIVEQLKSHRKFRNYSLKALADEAGFNTIQSFRKAFMSYNGVPVGYFIEQLKSFPHQIAV